jgi:hypothetical protein
MKRMAGADTLLWRFLFASGLPLLEFPTVEGFGAYFLILVSILCNFARPFPSKTPPLDIANVAVELVVGPVNLKHDESVFLHSCLR